MVGKNIFQAFVYAAAFALLLSPGHLNSQKLSIEISKYGTLSTGEEVQLFVLKNSKGMEVGILNYGGIITNLLVPDREGQFQDVVLGFENLSDYETRNPYFGALVGRYANRIAEGKFSLDGEEFKLVQNNGSNHIHGGTKGFDKVIWDAKPIEYADRVSLELTYTSKDMEEGYPGNLDCVVTYSLKENNELQVTYQATTNRKTIVNLTQHSYFNLSGDFSRPILDHELIIVADEFVPVDEILIPTGEYAPVAGTPFDFNKPKMIGRDIEDAHEQIRIGSGYDHSWVLKDYDSKIQLVSSVYHPETGRVLEGFTTEPGMQLYTGNFLDGTLPAKGGGTYARRTGFCLETQHHPDSPNQPEFPSVTLEPGQTYRSETLFKFSTKEK
jgi:aldose 1-epimerase